MEFQPLVVSFEGLYAVFCDECVDNFGDNQQSDDYCEGVEIKDSGHHPV